MKYDKILLRRVKLINCPLKGGGGSFFLNDDCPAHQEQIKTIFSGRHRSERISRWVGVKYLQLE